MITELHNLCPECKIHLTKKSFPDNLVDEWTMYCPNCRVNYGPGEVDVIPHKVLSKKEKRQVLTFVSIMLIVAIGSYVAMYYYLKNG